MVNDSMFASYCRAGIEWERESIIGICFLALVRWDQFLLFLLLCILYQEEFYLIQGCFFAPREQKKEFTHRVRICLVHLLQAN